MGLNLAIFHCAF